MVLFMVHFIHCLSFSYFKGPFPLNPSQLATNTVSTTLQHHLSFPFTPSFLLACQNVLQTFSMSFMLTNFFSQCPSTSRLSPNSRQPTTNEPSEFESDEAHSPYPNSSRQRFADVRQLEAVAQQQRQAFDVVHVILFMNRYPVDCNAYRFSHVEEVEIATQILSC